MRSYSSGGTTPPVGLHGEFTIKSLVFAVTAFSIAEARTVKPSSGCVSTYTDVPPAYFTMSGKLTQQGRGMMTSSPCWISTLITLKIECLPPTLTTHCFGSNDECSSRLCHAHIASRNGAMPPAGVYFDLSSWMARIPAFLIWSGVGKSGSPGPKSATSMPLAFIFSASARTAAVGEIWIRLMRSVSCTSSSFGECASLQPTVYKHDQTTQTLNWPGPQVGWVPVKTCRQVVSPAMPIAAPSREPRHFLCATNELAAFLLRAFCRGFRQRMSFLTNELDEARTSPRDLSLRHFRPQALLDNGGNQPLQRPAVLCDFPHQLGAQVAVGFSWQHKDGLQPRLELPVHQRHLQFVFVVRDGANAAQNHAGATFARVVHEQSVKNVHLDARPSVRHFAQHLYALGNAEQRLLFRVSQHGHDQQVKHFLAALDQVEVAVGHRVKGAGINGNRCFHCDFSIGVTLRLF